MNVDPTKPVEVVFALGGETVVHPARIAMTDWKGKWPWLVAVDIGDVEEAYHFKNDGTAPGTGCMLRNVREKRMIPEFWINVYPAQRVQHATKAEADDRAASGRIACLHVPAIEYVEGEGL